MARKRCFGCMELKENAVCEHCGFDERRQNAVHQLPVGTVLKDQYIIGRALGQGGFGITYLGWDRYLETRVAIKEYYPTGMVTREAAHSLSITNCEGENGEQFEYNRKRFLKEAQSLVKLTDIPEVVKVMGFFPDNGTAYIIMEYVQGVTLKDYLRCNGPMSGSQAMKIFRPVMEGLQQVHAAGMVHRDLSPDNIMLLPNGKVKILDFGAVRDYGKGSNMQSTQAILKPGFAPLEQYKSRGDLGPWTDVYALCATMYYCMTGKLPPDAPERMLEGTDPDWSLIRGFSQGQIQVLKRGMALRREDRIPTAGHLLDQLLWADSGKRTDEIPETAPVEPIYYTVPVNHTSYTAPVEQPSATRPVENSASYQSGPRKAPVEPESEPYRYVSPKVRKEAPKREMPQVPKQAPRQEQKKPKKQKAPLFMLLLLAMGLVVYLVGMVNYFIEDREQRERNAASQAQNQAAVQVGEEEVSGTVVNYYFVDMVNQLVAGEFQYYIQLGMLDPTMALNQQTNPMTGQPWSETVMERVLSQMEFNYAAAKAAREAGFEISAITEQIVKTEESLDLMARSYGYTSANAYLKAMYGEGASWASYSSYLECCYLADAYYTYYLSTLQLTDEGRRALETEMGYQFHSYSYNYYFIRTDSFQEIDGETAAMQAEKAANSIIGPGVTTPEKLDAAIAAQHNYDGSVTVPTSTQCTNLLGKDITQGEIKQWVSEKLRYSGEKAVLPRMAGDGSVEGYYVVLLLGVTDNRISMRNARHILVSAETPNAKEEAEQILAQWRAGTANQDSFAQLANQYSHDQSSVGGLYTDIYPGQMVAAFDRWVFDSKRYAGEVGIVETEYGFHVTYFVGNSGTIYRNWLIDRELRNQLEDQWIAGLRESIEVTVVNLSQVNTGIILQGHTS